MRRLIKDTIFQLFFLKVFWLRLQETWDWMFDRTYALRCARGTAACKTNSIFNFESNDWLPGTCVHSLTFGDPKKKKKKIMSRYNVSLKPLAPPTFTLSGVIKRSWTRCKATQIRWQRVIYHYFSALHGLFFYFSPEFLWDRLHV